MRWANEESDMVVVRGQLLLGRRGLRFRRCLGARPGSRAKEAAATGARQGLALDDVKGPHREPIPREVRRAVFTRDGGKCVECGSTFDLQYDHVLPVAHGGATTVENLQILCSDCNRRKSDAI